MSTRGVKVLVGGIVTILVGVVLLWLSGQQTGGTKTALVWAGILVVIIGGFGLGGLTPVAQGQARVV